MAATPTRLARDTCNVFIEANNREAAQRRETLPLGAAKAAGPVRATTALPMAAAATASRPEARLSQRSTLPAGATLQPPPRPTGSVARPTASGHPLLGRLLAHPSLSLVAAPLTPAAASVLMARCREAQASLLAQQAAFAALSAEDPPADRLGAWRSAAASVAAPLRAAVAAIDAERDASAAIIGFARRAEELLFWLARLQGRQATEAADKASDAARRLVAAQLAEPR